MIEREPSRIVWLSTPIVVANAVSLGSSSWTDLKHRRRRKGPSSLAKVQSDVNDGWSSRRVVSLRWIVTGRGIVNRNSPNISFRDRLFNHELTTTTTTTTTTTKAKPSVNTEPVLLLGKRWQKFRLLMAFNEVCQASHRSCDRL